jgi:putative transposase
VVKPAHKKEVVDYLIGSRSLSLRQACKMTGVARSGFYYVHKQPQKDAPVIEQLQNLAEGHPTYGFRKMFYRLRNEGYKWNHKRVYRIYKLLNLNLKRKHKRRLPVRIKERLEVPGKPNSVWSMDFMSHSLQHGRRFRTLNVIDDYNREICWLEIGLSIGSERVVRTVEHIIGQRGKPEFIRVDNGPEFTGSAFVEFCKREEIGIRYIQPGKPTQNAYIERFNKSYRNEVLGAYLFKSIQQVKQVSFPWVEDYNEKRPHESLNQLPPIKFAQQQNMN